MCFPGEALYAATGPGPLAQLGKGTFWRGEMGSPFSAHCARSEPVPGQTRTGSGPHRIRPIQVFNCFVKAGSDRGVSRPILARGSVLHRWGLFSRLGNKRQAARRWRLVCRFSTVFCPLPGMKIGTVYGAGERRKKPPIPKREWAEGDVTIHSNQPM